MRTHAQSHTRTHTHTYRLSATRLFWERAYIKYIIAIPIPTNNNYIVRRFINNNIICKYKTIILKEIENRRNIPVLSEKSDKIERDGKNTDYSEQNYCRFPALQHARRTRTIIVVILFTTFRFIKMIVKPVLCVVNII